MRFLNTRTGEFVERDPKETEYAILSHVWDSQGEQSYMKLSEIQKRYNLQARCLLHGTKSPPPTAAPPAPPDFSPLPSSVEHSSSAPGVHGPSTPSVSSTSDGAALPSHHLCPADIENERQDDPTTTHTEQPRLSRCLDTVWQFVLLVLLFPAYLQPLPSPDPQDSSPTFDDSRKTSHTPVEPSRDPPPHATEGDRSKTPSCCIWGDPELSSKIREACRVAREAGYDYLWIDSCCIDKSSSSELSESINSMYQWYGRSVECYAYLVDVPPGEDPRSPESKFRSSRWFRRGWTLQELIAPSEVKFLSNDWNIIGTKLTLVDIVDETTTIPWEALLRLEPLDVFSVAERLSWAARRETTRVEDRAYSLFGIFDINMPTLYGEGERAFRRLQEEILRRVPDQSLFAWQYVYQGPDMSEQPIACEVEYTLECIEWSPNVLLASSMNAFGADSRDIHIVPHAVLDQLQLSSLSTIEYTPTPQGIRTQIPLLPLSCFFPQSATIEYLNEIPGSQWYLAILGCEHKSSPGSLLGRVCYISPSGTGVDLLCSGCVDVSPTPSRRRRQLDLFPLSSATMERCHEHITLKTTYISHPERASTQSANWDARYKPHKTINLLLRRKTRDSLRAQGYTAELRGPDEGHPTTHWLTLSGDDCTITVEYRHTLENAGHRLMLEADVKMSRHALDEAVEIVGNPSSVSWEEDPVMLPWFPMLYMKEVTFTLAVEKLTVKLGLGWAAPSHYYIPVGIVTETLPVESSASLQLAWGIGAEGPGAGGEADEQDTGAEAGASEGGVLQLDNGLDERARLFAVLLRIVLMGFVPDSYGQLLLTHKLASHVFVDG